MHTGPWASRFTALQIALSTIALLAVLGAVWVSAAGSLQLMAARSSIAYLAVVAVWPTRRVARTLAAALEERAEGEVDGFTAAGAVIQAAMLPIYCAVVLLSVAVVAFHLHEAQPGTSLQEWFGTLSYAGIGILGMIASAIALLCIWRRRRRAGWIAVTVAQISGAAAVVVGFRLGFSALRPAEEIDTWYYWSASPPVLWLLFLATAAVLGVLAIIRLWRSIEDEPRAPWATVVCLVVLVVYLAGFGRLTGLWPTSWLYGAFFMARLSTYAFFVCEPKNGPVWRSGWFACYLATVVLCIATTAHQVATGNFGMMTQPLLMMPLPPIEMGGTFWAFSLSLTLTLTRDILFLLWLNRARPGGWGDTIGIVALVLLYGPIAMGLAILGWGFLFPVLYPLSVVGPVDLVWPVAMIGLLVALILRTRRDLWATNSLA